MMGKAEFVKTLEKAICAAGVGVVELSYGAVGPREYVVAVMTDGAEVHINVTGDSHIAIMHDVLRGIE